MAHEFWGHDKLSIIPGQKRRNSSIGVPSFRLDATEFRFGDFSPLGYPFPHRHLGGSPLARQIATSAVD
jgi:hypothetical protein